MDSERIMSEGDLLDYVRATEMLAAMRTVARKAPWKARAMRSAMNAETRKLEALAARYRGE